jgi:inorganic phosphate transporter, PiT family
VILATFTGFPISTTHALTGAIIGCGLTAAGSAVNFAALEKAFVLPLLLSPILAILIASIFYILFRAFRVATGIEKEWCVCVGAEERVVALPQASALVFRRSPPVILLTVDEQENCRERYAGSFFGIGVQKLMETGHFLSAGTMSFARGLNDTPKIVALLLLWKTLDLRWGFAAIALSIAIGGLFNAHKVADTMSKKITLMNHGQGFTANLTAALLVVAASLFGLPISTTHVSVGSLFGIGLTTGKANPRVLSAIALSWFITLPCAAIFAGAIYWIETSLHS